LAIELVGILCETDPEGIPAYDPDGTPSPAGNAEGVDMDAAETDSVEVGRLRRQLRAQSAVNRQLYAQLDGGGVGIASRRGAGTTVNLRRVAEGGSWLEQLQMHGGGQPFLVQTPTRRLYVIDGDLRRQVKAGMLFAALTRVLGAPRELSDHDLERWSPGPPVEVLEADSGPAFVVVGGRRLPLRGLPLPYLVSSEDMLLFPEGEELNIAASFRPAPRSRSARAREVLRKEGPVRGGAKLARAAVRRIAK
jgi:hypothetical protein